MTFRFRKVLEMDGEYVRKIKPILATEEILQLTFMSRAAMILNDTIVRYFLRQYYVLQLVHMNGFGDKHSLCLE